MIDNYREQILSILLEAGEDVGSEELSFSRLGEGLGYTSLLWSVQVGGAGRYAVKITDLKSRLEEAKKIYGEDQEKIDSHTTLFAQQHNRELQAYQYLETIRKKERAELGKVAKFFGGVECSIDSVGMIIMADLGADSISLDPSEEGLPLETILSTIDGIAQYQAAYLSTDRECDLLAKDVLFVLGSAGVIKCIESVDGQGYLSEQWKSALLSWSTPEALREMQYGREEGEPPLVNRLYTDMWTNNMLFKRNERGGIELLAFVDWQCATVGLALLDVASVVGMNMSAEKRRKSEESILSHYLAAMEGKRGGFVKEFQAEFDSLNLLYRRCLRFAALQLCLHVGGMLTDPVGDSVEARENRRKHVEQRTHVAERLKGLLEDIVQ